MAGDKGGGAGGTRTYVDGSHMYAFGHPFLGIRGTSLPFPPPRFITPPPKVKTPFKLSPPPHWRGSLSPNPTTPLPPQPRARPPMVPIPLAATRSSKSVETYQMQMVNDPLLSPLLLQMAVFSVIDRTERTLGAATLRVTGEMEFQNAPESVRLDNLYSADN